jgi:FkbM family methyltransferase
MQRRELAAEAKLRTSGADGSSPYLMVDTPVGVFCLSAEDRGVSRKLFVRQRTAAQEALERSLEILGREGREPSPGSAFVDVGAHIGTATLAAMADGRFARGVAVEPEPGNFRLLRVNLLLNDLAERVTALRAAASDADGELSLRTNPELHGGHKVTAASPDPDRVSPVIAVEAVSLESACRRAALAPADVGLVKVDGQGHEPEILRGGGRLWEAGVPVLVEYWPGQLEKTGRLEEFEAFLAERFERIYDLGSAGRAGDVPALASADAPSRRPADEGRKKGDLLLLAGAG